MYTTAQLSQLTTKHRNEIIRRRAYRKLKKVQHRHFLLQMKDRWSRKDYCTNKSCEIQSAHWKKIIGSHGSSKYNSDGTTKLSATQQKQINKRNDDYGIVRNLRQQNEFLIKSQDPNDQKQWKENMQKLTELRKKGIY